MSAVSVIWLAVLGVAVAALPLLYVGLSRDPRKFRRLAWVTAFLTVDLIMFGSFTRLTDSGLGCPDWPGCYGHSNPLSAGEPIMQAQTAMPSGPVTVTKAWIEMLHRYLAMAVGVLVIVLTVQAWRRQTPAGERGGSRWLAMVTLIWICVQGAFGALTVTLKLQPAIVTLHLLGGVVLLALLTWLALREDHVPVTVAPQVRTLAVAALIVVFVQIALGGWVSSNYAVMACPDFPLCQGELWPPMNFSEGFTGWRPLGRTADGALISFQALVAIHWAHRAFAVVVVVAIGALALRLRRESGVSHLARGLLALLILQLLTGLSNVVLQWPLLLAVLHSGGAALLVAMLVAVLQRTSHKSLDLRLAVRSSPLAAPISE